MSKLPAGKTTKEVILELAAQGMTASEIARKTGIKYNTVYFHLNPDKFAKKPARKTEEGRRVPKWGTALQQQDKRVIKKKGERVARIITGFS